MDTDEARIKELLEQVSAIEQELEILQTRQVLEACPLSKGDQVLIGKHKRPAMVTGVFSSQGRYRVYVTYLDKNGSLTEKRRELTAYQINTIVTKVENDEAAG